MKKIIKEYEIYTFNELSEDAKERAIADFIDTDIEIYSNDAEDCYFYDSILEARKLQTPWFLGNIIYENHKEDIIESIRINNYGFFKNGELIGLEFYPKDWK